ncbi:phospholipase D-like domain-containing protein [Acidovorax sp.]|uniref:phospholipase D family protein n=1 Tax=Acidovorax sp. TaxID=1872122 RepID=UPI00261D264A|nr:phospholipase D-like domain-containing protein [Acidovorax sp.]
MSHALTDTSTTPLAQMVAQQRSAAKAQAQSGFVLLSGPQEAYGGRLALVQAATRSLDLQYYAIHADASTSRLLTDVAAAARRGVRVRVLLDDFHSTGQDAQVLRLAFVPNVEMRLFNPVTGPRGWQLGRMVGMLSDFDRAQKRMHNKLFIADNQLGIAGGRNLGDAYFGQAEAGNFVDLDVLAAGPVVLDLSRSFDSYWNNALAYPVQSLISRRELRTLKESMQASGAVPAPAKPSANGESGAPTTKPAASPTRNAQNAKAWNEKPLPLDTLPWVWAPAGVLADLPTKIPANPALPPADTASAPLPSPSQQLQALAQQHAPKQAPAIAAAAVPDDDSVVDGLLQIMAHAQQDLLIVSPYFVPGPDMKQAFTLARERGVRVRVLTNSLASNDAPIAHAGYARHRPELLRMGVELYEMRSELAGLRSALASGAGSSGSSRAMLHSKFLIVDSRLLVVGSMNLDMRSQKHNTEIALLIGSDELSHQALTRLETGLQDATWRVELDEQGELIWRAPAGSDRTDSRTEPDASAPLRLMLHLLGPLAPDHLL